MSGLFLSFNLPPRPAAASDGILGETALEDLVDDDLTYRDHLLHHAFQEIENKPFIINPSSFILFTMPSSTLSNDLLSDKRLDFPFVNPPYGYEWSKDYDAVTTREPMQNNPSVRQRPGQRGIKQETLPPPLPCPHLRANCSKMLSKDRRGGLFNLPRTCSKLTHTKLL